MVNILLNWLLKSWDAGRVVPILAYHAVDDDPIDLSITPRLFQEQMSWLRKSAKPITLLELESLFSGKIQINRPVAITFDDGVCSLYEAAFPVLRDLNIPFALFLPTGLVGGSFLLRGHSKPVLSWGQIQEILGSGLMTLGLHTHFHTILVDCPPEKIIAEIELSYEEYYQHTGTKPRYFAFPKGKTDDTSQDVIRKYFPMAFAREGLQYTEKVNYHAIRRIGIKNQMTSKNLLWTFSPLFWKAKQVRQWLS